MKPRPSKTDFGRVSDAVAAKAAELGMELIGRKNAGYSTGKGPQAKNNTRRRLELYFNDPITLEQEVELRHTASISCQTEGLQLRYAGRGSASLYARCTYQFRIIAWRV